MQKVSYIGDGSTTEFYFNFPFYANTDIIVLKNTQTATNFMVVGTDGGLNSDFPYTNGKVVFDIAPSSTDIITIYRHIPLTRVIDYQPTEKIDPVNLNQDMNYMLEILKDMQDNLDVFEEQYNDIVNKESTENLLSKISAFNQKIDSGDIMETDVFYSYMTNCITEIPQNIKFELSSGTLTLKSGSKIYIPNGSGVFDTVTTTADISTSRTDSSDCMVWYNTDGTLTVFPVNLFYSGSSAPTAYTFMFWYDTTNNKCKRTSDSGSTWEEGKSFPLCLVATDGTKISSIKQVFNGFGYIGSTIFVLPGIKGIIPNGKNKDGTYNNIIISTSNVIVRNDMGISVNNYKISLNTGYFLNYSSDYTLGQDGFLHIPNGTIYKDIVFAKYSTGADGRITSFVPKNVFNSADYYNI